MVKKTPDGVSFIYPIACLFLLPSLTLLASLDFNFHRSILYKIKQKLFLGLFLRFIIICTTFNRNTFNVSVMFITLSKNSHDSCYKKNELLEEADFFLMLRMRVISLECFYKENIVFCPLLCNTFDFLIINK